MAESLAGTMPAAAKAFDLLQGKDTKGIQQGILEMGDADSRQEAANIYARLNNMSGKTDQEKMAAMMKAVASGKVESATFIKMMAAILSYQAQPKLDKMKKMSIAAEGRFGATKSDLMMTANAAGLDPALAKVWDNLTNTLKEFQPLIPTLVAGFDKLTTAAEMPARTLKGLNNIVGDLADTFGTTKGNMAGFIITATAVGGMLATKWGRVAMAFSVVALVVEDLVTYFGKTENTDTLIGSLIDSLGLDRTNEFESKVGDIVAVVGGLTTVLAAYALARGKLPKWALPSTKTAATAAAGGAAAGGARGAAAVGSRVLGFVSPLLGFADRLLKIGVTITAAWDIVTSTIEDGFSGLLQSLWDQLPLLLMAFGSWPAALFGGLWTAFRMFHPDNGTDPRAVERINEIEVSSNPLDVMRGEITGEPHKKFVIPPYDGYKEIRGGLEGYDLLSAHNNKPNNTSWTIPKIEINITSADGSPEEVASTLRSTIDDVVNNIISGVKAQYITP